ncbi:Do family serine endopeptidase [Acuticoccus mangrovi]|uniref:Do family serine endopeptidase n=1 Tax=Acuticoccus mangrovi TaxID=2796142 RepID=A0A934MJV6_9HYPH|nr:Do family serine endopeptidase [Acuticoccus mangrovi]MBJ3778706.1 Do family serine endopeptidase [Acuticoccus mangrovi]
MRLLLVLLIAIAAPAGLSAQEVPASRAEISLSFAPIVRNAAPAVVNVYSAQRNDRGNLGMFDDDPFMRRFFGGPRMHRRGPTLGSGVIVDPSGLIITNAHVVKDAREIRVGFSDRREFEASLLLKDERTDLAVLKIESDEKFPSLPLGDPTNLEVGDLVLAIGNPFGVGQTVTQGIVSALARTQVGIADSRFFIQTDAAINPGNSGGALIDMAGRLVGINTAIYSRSGGSIGIGFAIPVDMVKIVLQSARDGGTVRRPWFGARLESVTRELAGQLDLDRPAGALVTELVDGSPAAAAGLKVADVIVSVDGIDIADQQSFGYIFATRGISGSAELGVMRDGKPRTLTVALEAPPEEPARDARHLEGRSPFDGALAMNLSPRVADELNLELTSRGVVIASVDPRSVARRVGLRPGDVVREVNGYDVPDSQTLANIAAERERYWDIVIERNGEQLNLLLGG